MIDLYSIRNGLLAVAMALLPLSGSFAQITGTVYRDFDASGTRTLNLPAEPGVPRIVVTAYVNQSTTPISVTTDAGGAYAFTAGQIPPAAAVRLEFTNLDDGFFFGPAGIANQSNVRFVIAPATAINCGINDPADYCQNGEVSLLIPCFVKGDPLATTNADGAVAPANQAGQSDVLVAFPIGASGLASATNFPPRHMAMASEMGSVWGVAYLKAERKALSAATIKRHAGLGTLGTGGIYITDIASATTAPFFDFQADLNIATGADPHSGLNADKTMTSSDPGPMSTVGRIGLGGIDLSKDSKTLYAVNMLDRKLYGIYIDAPARKPGPADVKSWAIDQSGCPNGDFRPWAVYVYRQHVYVGGVCSGENQTPQITNYSSATAALAATLPTAGGLKAIVMRIDPRQGNSATFQTVLSFPLTFQRGPTDRTNDCATFVNWLPWTNEFPIGCNSTRTSVMWPQPILSDLAFDDNGDMVIGMLDRFGHLAGTAEQNPAGQGFYNGFTGGDILRATVTAPDNSAYRLESNGSVGGRTAGSNTIPGSGQTMTPPYTPTGGTIQVGGVANGQGPGGGEFYFNDQWYFNVGNNIGHDELANGSIIIRPGSNEVLTSAFDPITDVWHSGGVKVYSSLDGTATRNYALYGFNTPGTFGKVSGLGDGELMCDAQPIEIGNRVWFDGNRNGIQDPAEAGINGVTISLCTVSGGVATQVATTITANGGLYVFNNTNVPAGLRYNQSYQVKMGMGQLSNLNLATAQSDSQPLAGTAPQTYYVSPATVSVGTTARDNNALLTGSDAVVTLRTGSYGENSYDFDLSVYACPLIEATLPSTQTVCSAAQAAGLVVTGSSFASGDQVRFIGFNTPQTTTSVYNGGTVLATMPLNMMSQATLPASLVGAQLSASTPVVYIYAVVVPGPDLQGGTSCFTMATFKLVLQPPVCVPLQGIRIR